MEQTKFELKFINPLTNEQDSYFIDTSNRSRMGFNRLKSFETQDQLIDIINGLLKSIDCSRLICNMPQTKIGCCKYDNDMSDLIYYCNKLINPIDCQQFIDTITSIHVNNILFEHSRIEVNTKTKTKNTKKKKLKEPWIVRETIDLFTNEKVYVYTNVNTGEEITSSDSDKLKELNAPKKKEKRTKSNIVPMEHMTFSFKIK